MAIGGGLKAYRGVQELISYGRQTIDRADIRAVVSALKSSWLTQGPRIEEFERAFAERCGAPYAVAVSSGTAGLHLAALVAGLKKGDEAVTTPMTFAATANCVLYVGARPRFTDIDPVTINIDSAQIAGRINSKTKAVLPVHFAGMPCTVGSKAGLFKRKDIVIIEDACHALGAEIRVDDRWRPVGSCEDADMAVFSFHPVKHITTGEGGMITTRRRDLYDKLRLLRSHGIERDPGKLTNRSEAGNPWYYEMTTLGFNYRITDFQCALGLSQLKKLSRFVAARREIAAFYDKRLSGLDHVRVPACFEDRRSSYHLYVLRINFEALGKSRRQVMEELRKKGIGTQVHYIPVTRQPYYCSTLGERSSDYPNAEVFYQQALSIPMHPSLSKGDRSKVVREIRKVCRSRKRNQSFFTR